MIPSWIRKWRTKPCNDYLTRLGSDELARLQHVTRNGLIAARMDVRKAAQALIRASKKLEEVENALKESR